VGPGDADVPRGAASAWVVARTSPLRRRRAQARLPKRPVVAVDVY
jgi:hypothetical protein